ncbi:hypothetical protein BH11ACT2_BH11ACT2_02700 [soil metagenome]
MASETTEPEAPPTPPPAPPHSNRFFGWMRATGVIRQPGWIGGVCAGIAERLGIDPLIVRGVAVVVAVLGGPAILLYAAAWLLLPDRFDRIHLEQLLRGKVEAPIAAIAGLVILSMLPVTQGFWSAGAAFWQGGVSVGRIIWTAILLAALVGVIVWVARRSSPSAPPPPPTTPPSPTAAQSTIIAPPTRVAPPRPERPGTDATTEDFAAWRDQQAAWKAERAAFQAQEAATLREVNRARAQERREATATRNAVYAERHAVWLRANPRLSGALVATAIGLAILAGGIAGLVASTLDDWKGAEVAAGFGTATLVLGIAIVLAAAFGRRNGFMIFLSVVLLAVTLLSAAVPNDRQLVGVGFSSSRAGTYTQLTGSAQLYSNAGSGGVLDLWQGAGTTSVNIARGQTVRVEIVSRTRSVRVQRAVASDYVQQPEDLGVISDSGGTITDVVEEPEFRRTDDSAYRYSELFGPATVPDETIRIWQGTGAVQITDDNQKDDNQKAVTP